MISLIEFLRQDPSNLICYIQEGIFKEVVHSEVYRVDIGCGENYNAIFTIFVFVLKYNHLDD